MSAGREEEQEDTTAQISRNSLKRGMTPEVLKHLHTGLEAAFPEEEIGENVDILVLLNFAIFMERLAKASEKEARNTKKKPKKVTFQTEQGNQDITMHIVRSRHLEKCAQEELRKMRG